MNSEQFLAILISVSSFYTFYLQEKYSLVTQVGASQDYPPMSQGTDCGFTVADGPHIRPLLEPCGLVNGWESLSDSTWSKKFKLLLIATIKIQSRKKSSWWHTCEKQVLIEE